MHFYGRTGGMIPTPAEVLEQKNSAVKPICKRQRPDLVRNPPERRIDYGYCISKTVYH